MAVKKSISPKQKEILDFVKKQISKNGFPPTVREICDAVGLSSTSTVHSHLAALEKKGYIKHDPAKPRTIEINDSSFRINRSELINVPVLKTVKHNEPLLDGSNIETYFPVPSSFLDCEYDYFIIRAKGESMVDAGIYDGNLLIIRMQDHAVPGNYVLAVVDENPTVKTYSEEKGKFVLTPENSYMQPVILDDIKIIGVVAGNLRFY